jgi:cytochrome c oxidase subunit 3
VNRPLKYTHFSASSSHKKDKAHPYRIILGFSMASSGFLFLVMLGLYAIQRFQVGNPLDTIYIPKAFILSTLVILGSSFLLVKAKQHFFKDEVAPTLRLLGVVFLLGIGFVTLQMVGWAELHAHGFHFPDLNVASSYVYVITGIHLAHVALAVGLMGYLWYSLYKKSRDLVSRLVMETNPYEKQKFDVVVALWHYVDLLWVILFLVFVFTF